LDDAAVVVAPPDVVADAADVADAAAVVAAVALAVVAELLDLELLLPHAAATTARGRRTAASQRDDFALARFLMVLPSVLTL
jgi:hypothetical protein